MFTVFHIYFLKFSGGRMLLDGRTDSKLFAHRRKESSAVCQFIWTHLDYILGIYETEAKL